jgi:hypothetical protein
MLFSIFNDLPFVSNLFIDMHKTIIWSRTSKKKLLKQEKHLQL